MCHLGERYGALVGGVQRFGSWEGWEYCAVGSHIKLLRALWYKLWSFGGWLETAARVAIAFCSMVN